MAAAPPCDEEREGGDARGREAPRLVLRVVPVMVTKSMTETRHAACARGFERAREEEAEVGERGGYESAEA